MKVPDPSRSSLPLWPLPLLCALLPFVAAHLGWWLSTEQGLIAACNPYLDGCASISRAARHGLGNHLFRMLMLPAATLQALCWLAVAQWLQRDGDPVRVVSWLGLVAGVFLAVYATFLGSEGKVYELLRRHGVYLYFGSTYLALLFTLQVLSRRPKVPIYRALLVVALGFLAVGLTSIGASYAVTSEALRDRWENVLEWHLGLWLTALFVTLAWYWRRERLRCTLGQR
ncbi:MAG TPA: hypothetical protein VGD21_13270 [Lysobacter sp.]